MAKESGKHKKPYRVYCRTSKQGYTQWRHIWSKEQYVCAVHQLLAVAEGDDPNEVFSDETEVHHLNGIPWDNRGDNIVTLSKGLHYTITIFESLSDDQKETFREMVSV